MRQTSSSSQRGGSRSGQGSRRRRRSKKGGVYTFYSRLVAGCALAVVALLWVSAASVHVHPDGLGILAWMGLMFPAFLAGVVCMLVFTLLLCRQRVWIPIVGLLGCCLTIRQYVPVNLPSPAPKQSLKLMSFNVMGYNPKEKDADGRTSMLRYLSRSGADIICAQEAALSVKLWKESHGDPFVRALPYCDTVQIIGPGGTNGLTVFSRYPIVGKRKLCSSATNGAALFKILIGKGDTLNVINCHFESNHLSAEERSAYREMVHQPGRQELKEGEREHLSIVRKFRSRPWSVPGRPTRWQVTWRGILNAVSWYAATSTIRPFPTAVTASRRCWTMPMNRRETASAARLIATPSTCVLTTSLFRPNGACFPAA